MAANPYPASHSDNTVRRQHAQLNSLLEAIENRFRHDHQPSRNLVSLLNSLAVHLQTHFEFEEADGYFEDIIQKAPRLVSAVDQLIQEHSKMLQEIDELIKIARDDFAFKHDTTGLAKRYGQFRDKLAAHEHMENKLVQEAYNVDVGTKD